MKPWSLIKKHFRNINLIDLYFEKYYSNQQLLNIKSIFVNLSDSGICDNVYGENIVVISLTTFGLRAYNVYQTITSLMCQTLKANKIILWLSNKEFDDSSIPDTLKKLQKYGLEIKYCEDIKSYKKIIPTLGLNLNADIITVDDDIIYPIDFIEKMILAHKANPNKVCFTRGCRIDFDGVNILSYKNWPKATNKCSMLNVPTGIGGILYPFGCFYKDVGNSSIFMKLCPNADDLWLRIMCFINHVDTFYINSYEDFNHYFIEIKGSQITSLNAKNNSNSGQMTNDSQFRSLVDYYCLKNTLFKYNQITSL